LAQPDLIEVFSKWVLFAFHEESGVVTSVFFHTGEYKYCIATNLQMHMQVYRPAKVGNTTLEISGDKESPISFLSTSSWHIPILNEI
jgi:hypothetical protein